MPQTSIQESTTIRFGSGIFEIGDDVGSLVNVGAFRGGKFEETYDKVSVMSDNAGEVYAGIKNHMAKLSCELLEVNLDTLQSVADGIASVTTTDTTPVGVTDEVHLALTGTTQVRLDHKNGDGTEVASITVTDSDDNPAVRDTDYVIAVDSAGYTTIARVSTSTVITEGDGVKVDYTYTPLSQRLYKSGGLMQLNPRVVRFTNTNAAGEDFEITVFKATAAQGITIEFPADDADDVVRTPIVLEGKVDTTRTAGDQLFEIRDEQHST